MKTLLLVTFATSLMVTAANANINVAQKPARKSCVTRKLDCLDYCDYHQDTSKIASCKSHCRRKYGCRIPKKRLPNTGGGS